MCFCLHYDSARLSRFRGDDSVRSKCVLCPPWRERLQSHLAESELEEETRLKIRIMAILQRSAADPTHVNTNHINMLKDIKGSWWFLSTRSHLLIIWPHHPTLDHKVHGLPLSLHAYGPIGGVDVGKGPATTHDGQHVAWTEAEQQD